MSGPARSVIIHGHFYQPPREDPWFDVGGREPSAAPYHDWNERITAECYRPNARARILDEKDRIIDIANNYSRISFNFGPTLLSWLERHDPFAALERTAGRVAHGIAGAARAAGIPAVGAAVGSMVGVFFRESAPRSFEEAKTSDAAAFARFHREMLARGVFLAPSPFEAGFVSTVHGEAEVEATLAAATEAAHATRG